MSMTLADRESDLAPPLPPPDVFLLEDVSLVPAVDSLEVALVEGVRKEGQLWSSGCL